MIERCTLRQALPGGFSDTWSHDVDDCPDCGAVKRSMYVYCPLCTILHALAALPSEPDASD